MLFRSNRMMYVTTPDFITFSKPKTWIDVDRRGQAGAGSIEAASAQIDEILAIATLIGVAGTRQARQLGPILSFIDGVWSVEFKIGPCSPAASCMC